MKAPHQLTALQARQAIAAGTLTSETLVRSCIERIEERNPQIKAFTAFDQELSLAHARLADRSGPGGPLSGIPFACKDVIETVDFDTAYGSPIYSGYRPRADAGCVATARENGAILLGKVATGEFATQTPSAARNPLAPDHTPGGSSSGSAAAVADCMVPVAFGTQTTASIVRPAIYCGVVGYKPSFDFISVAGMKVLSPSQDTVGLITRDVADAAYFAYGLQGAQLLLEKVDRPRIGVCMSSQWDHASAATVESIERLAATLERHGATVVRVTLPRDLEQMVDVQARLFVFEAWRALAFERLHHGDQLSARLRARLEEGIGIGPEEYLDMRILAAQARQRVRKLFGAADVLLYPAADGEAEAGLEYAGSPRFGALWTLLHLPCVSFPTGKGPGGLPVGAQLIGPFGSDTRLLAISDYVSKLAID